MRLFRNIFSQTHRWILWALLSAVFWSWIFGLVTNTDPAHKVVLYANVDEMQDKALALRLEEEKPEGIKMIKVHPFSYAMFDDGELAASDLYVLSAADVEQQRDSFAPLAGEDFDRGGRELCLLDGAAYGVKIYDAATGEGAAAEYLGYDPDTDYYLFFNIDSPHLSAGDGAALRVAELLLKLD